MASKYTLKRVAHDGDPTILDGLNPAQREAASTVHGPLLILAGAGSGKTRVVTHRIAHMVQNEGIRPDEILAVTFTNKAAAEMRERVDDLLGPEREDVAWRVTISTFHSLCARLLREFSTSLGLTRHFVIYDDADQRSLVKRILSEQGQKTDKATIAHLRDFIEKHKNAGRTPAQAHESAHSSGAEEDAFFYEKYQAELRGANCVDFGDLILGVLEICRKDPKIATKLSKRWRYVMVDEFQDTNPAQYELLRHLTKEHANLCVVGDDDQAIYRWRGATIENILGFDDDFPETVVVKLEQNYRSTQVILDAANDIIQQNSGRRAKSLWTDQAGGAPITTFAGTDDREEAVWVAQSIERTRENGVDYNDIGVFYRTNAQARSFEEQLRFAHIPYQIVGGMSFYAREEIKDLLAYLKVALNPRNEIDLERVLTKLTSGVGKSTIDKLRVAAALPETGSTWAAIEWMFGERETTSEPPPGWLPGIDAALPVDPALEGLEALSSRPTGGLRAFYDLITGLQTSLDSDRRLAVIVQELLNTIDYAAYLQKKDSERADDKLRNAHELVNAIDEFEKNEAEGLPAIDTLRGFLDRSALLASTDGRDPTLGAVTLMTVHSSKGLEYDTVFLAGMEDEIFPSLREDTEEELEEERRLAYVAITRAKRKLYISFAHRRRVFGQYRDTTPSRFLDAIDPERLEEDPRSASRSFGYGGGRSGGYGGGGYGRRGSNIGRQRDAWDYDQSATMTKGAVTRAARAEAAKKKFDEYSQLPEWDDFAQDAWTEEVAEDAALTGRTCSHTKFGIGEIIAESGHGDMATLTIQFASGDQKKIKRKFVKVFG